MTPTAILAPNWRSQDDFGTNNISAGARVWLPAFRLRQGSGGHRFRGRVLALAAFDPTMDNGFRQLKEHAAVMDFQPMSPEEMQRTMQFLLQQQARFDARIEQLSVKTDRIADVLIGLTGIVGRVADQVDQLARAQDEDARQLRLSREQLEKADIDLREYIQTVESHLDVLIEMFERHLREDHGSGPS